MQSSLKPCRRSVFLKVHYGKLCWAKSRNNHPKMKARMTGRWRSILWSFSSYAWIQNLPAGEENHKMFLWKDTLSQLFPGTNVERWLHGGTSASSWPQIPGVSSPSWTSVAYGQALLLEWLEEGDSEPQSLWQNALQHARDKKSHFTKSRIYIPQGKRFENINQTKVDTHMSILSKAYIYIHTIFTRITVYTTDFHRQEPPKDCNK